MPRKNKKRGKLSSNKYRGKLIKGMSDDLPSDLLSDPIFKNELKKVMKGFSGIYALYNGDDLYYVGLARNLHRRLKNHMRDRHARKWNYFKIFRIKKTNYIKDIETLLHNVIQTRGNKIKGKLPKDTNINHILREIVHDYEKKIKIVKKALK